MDPVRPTPRNLFEVEGPGAMLRWGLEYGAEEFCCWSWGKSCMPKSQFKSEKLSRKPRRSVVSDGEKRSAGGGFGNKFGREGSKENSKSEKGPGGCGGAIAVR